MAAILSYENGKSRYESIGEVDEAIDFMRYYANELEMNKGILGKLAGAEHSRSRAGIPGCAIEMRKR